MLSLERSSLFLDGEWNILCMGEFSIYERKEGERPLQSFEQKMQVQLFIYLLACIFIHSMKTH